MEGGEDKIRELKEAEKSLTAELSLYLQQLLLNKEEDNIVQFKEFWGSEKLDENDEYESDGEGDQLVIKDGRIAIVSPYNRLNDEIRDMISKQYDELKPDTKRTIGISGWNADEIREFIKCSTVDKFQGQERDVIIACYGERNVDSLLFIKDFVYNRNRLNVVISRAKKKCIIILSDILAKRRKECYDDSDESVVNGVEFMCGLKEYLSSEEPEDEYGGKYTCNYMEFDYPFDFKGKKESVHIRVYEKGYNKC